MSSNKENAIAFGSSLDHDEFDATKKLLSEDCEYVIGNNKLHGPEDICSSYEQNAIEGRAKLDQLIWGQSEIEAINESEFYVHFTDHLTHKNQKYTHRCKQRLTFDQDGLIIQIHHIND